MSDPRKQLTEEVPESPADFEDRRLTEVDGQTKAVSQTLTEDLPEDLLEDEETDDRQTLLG